MILAVLSRDAWERQSDITSDAFIHKQCGCQTAVGLPIISILRAPQIAYSAWIRWNMLILTCNFYAFYRVLFSLWKTFPCEFSILRDPRQSGDWSLPLQRPLGYVPQCLWLTVQFCRKHLHTLLWELGSQEQWIIIWHCFILCTSTSLSPTPLYLGGHSQPALAMWLILVYLTYFFLAHMSDQSTLILSW